MSIQGLSLRIKVALSRIRKLMATEIHGIPGETWKSRTASSTATNLRAGENASVVTT